MKRSIAVLAVLSFVVGACDPQTSQVTEPGSPTEEARLTDPYADVAVPTVSPEVAGPPPAPVPACPTACFRLQWQRLADVIDITGFGVGVEGAAAGVLIDPNDGKQKIYVSHGFSFGDNSVLRVYDIVADAWSLGPPASVSRSEGTGAAVGNKLYSIGGRPAQGTVEIFDPTGAGSWAGGPAMPTARAGLGVAVLGGKIHAVGGRLGGAPLDGPGLATHEIFDPTVPGWAPGPPMPVAMGDVYATTAMAGRMYVVGGWNGGANTSVNQIFNAGAGAWALGAPMPTPRSNAIAGALGGRVIVIGGLATPSPFVNSNVVEAYDPVFDTWCTCAAKPRAASEMASTGVTTSNAIHAIGSGSFGLSANFHEALILTKVDCACPRTQGFWKNHKNAWPIGSLTLGSESYTQAELLALLKKPVKGDASLILAKQLIAAKLNYAAGGDRPDAVTAAILDADDLLATFVGKLPYGVTPSSSTGQAMTAIAGLLDDYNNAQLTPDCPPS